MDRLVVRRECGFFNRLAQRRVAVTRPRDVLGRRAVLHGQDALGDELPGVGAHNMSAQDLVGLCVRDELDDAFRVVRSARARVCHEREFSGLVRDAGGLDFFFGLADGGGLGPGVDDGRDGGVVDMTGFALSFFILFLEKRERKKKSELFLLRTSTSRTPPAEQTKNLPARFSTHATPSSSAL